MTFSETLPDAETIGDSDAPEDAADVLYICFCGASPMLEAEPIDLSGIDEVVLARGPTFEVERLAGRLASVRLPDPHISDPHARIVWQGGARVLEDMGSRNGTFVNAEATRRAELTDGALITVGRTGLLLRQQKAELLEAMSRAPAPAAGLKTCSPGLALQFRRLQQIAAYGLPVFFSGETGTGKEVSARALHQLSGRRGSFIGINCGALPESIIESELFGYKRGAFSGATSDRMGLIRAAHQGTLFLDEIADLPASAQVKLLRVIQQHEVVPLGATSPEPVDFRLAAATHQNLADLVATGRFRTDLWSRLRGFEVSLPPLRERREDLATLVAVLLRRHAPVHAAEYRFDRRAVELMTMHRWPLNVRELERVIELGVGLAGESREIRGDLLAPVLTPAAPPTPKPTRRDPEDTKNELLRLLTRHQGNVTLVAREMGHTRMQIHRWIKRFGVSLESYRKT